jgi:hypothetical protein
MEAVAQTGEGGKTMRNLTGKKKTRRSNKKTREAKEETRQPEKGSRDRAGRGRRKKKDEHDDSFFVVAQS